MAPKQASATAKAACTLRCIDERALPVGSRGPIRDASLRALKQVARRSGESPETPSDTRERPTPPNSGSLSQTGRPHASYGFSGSPRGVIFALF